MNSFKNNLTKASSVVLATSMLAACGMSDNIKEDGTGAEQINWHSSDNIANPSRPDKTPSLAALRSIRSGTDKSEVYQLLGPPHYGTVGFEGFGPREWSYIFKLSTPDHDVKECHYKVFFDKEGKARSSYWKPGACADLIYPPEEPEKIALSGDTLFEFDSAELSSQGRRELDKVADKITARENAIESIEISGHTDPIGQDDYNQQLSQDRAESVVQYLEDQGISRDLMTARGMGASDLVKTDCDNEPSRADRIACFKPNRRVEFEITGQSR